MSEKNGAPGTRSARAASGPTSSASSAGLSASGSRMSRSWWSTTKISRSISTSPAAIGSAAAVRNSVHPRQSLLTKTKSVGRSEASSALDHVWPESVVVSKSGTARSCRSMPLVCTKYFGLSCGGRRRRNLNRWTRLAPHRCWQLRRPLQRFGRDRTSDMTLHRRGEPPLLSPQSSIHHQRSSGRTPSPWS